MPERIRNLILSQSDLDTVLTIQELLSFLRGYLQAAVEHGGAEEGPLTIADPLPEVPALVAGKEPSPPASNSHCRRLARQDDLEMLQAFVAVYQEVLQHIKQRIPAGVEAGELKLVDPIPDIPAFIVPRQQGGQVASA